MARLTFSRKILNNRFQYLFDVRADSSCSVKTNDKNHSKKQNHSHGLMIVGRVKDQRWMGRHLNPRSVNTEKQEVAVLGNPNIHPVFVRSEMRDLRCFQQTTKVTLRGPLQGRNEGKSPYIKLWSFTIQTFYTIRMSKDWLLWRTMTCHPPERNEWRRKLLDCRSVILSIMKVLST